MGSIEEARWADLMRDLREWLGKWEAIEIDSLCGYRLRGEFRKAMLKSRSEVRSLCLNEGWMLPSGPLYNRMVMLDDRIIRRIFMAAPEPDRASILAEATEYANTHGGSVEAHKSRLIRSRYGIPSF